MEKKDKKGKINYSIFLFFSTIKCRCIQNLKIVALIGPEKSVTKIFIGEKWTNKGNEKHEDANSLLYNTTSCTQCL